MESPDEKTKGFRKKEKNPSWGSFKNQKLGALSAFPFTKLTTAGNTT